MKSRRQISFTPVGGGDEVVYSPSNPQPIPEQKTYYRHAFTFVMTGTNDYARNVVGYAEYIDSNSNFIGSPSDLYAHAGTDICIATGSAETKRDTWTGTDLMFINMLDANTFYVTCADPSRNTITSARIPASQIQFELYLTSEIK